MANEILSVEIGSDGIIRNGPVHVCECSGSAFFGDDRIECLTDTVGNHQMGDVLWLCVWNTMITLTAIEQVNLCVVSGGDSGPMPNDDDIERIYSPIDAGVPDLLTTVHYHSQRRLSAIIATTLHPSWFDKDSTLTGMSVEIHAGGRFLVQDGRPTISKRHRVLRRRHLGEAMERLLLNDDNANGTEQTDRLDTGDDAEYPPSPTRITVTFLCLMMGLLVCFGVLCYLHCVTRWWDDEEVEWDQEERNRGKVEQMEREIRNAELFLQALAMEETTTSGASTLRNIAHEQGSVVQPQQHQQQLSSHLYRRNIILTRNSSNRSVTSATDVTDDMTVQSDLSTICTVATSACLTQRQSFE